jgi:uncharacterized damage-inducible protein DinB
METIAEVLFYVKYGRDDLLKAINGLSQREMTQLPVYGEWTVKEILAHIIGWDQRVIKILPMIVQNRANEIPGVEVESHNRQSVAAWRDRSIVEVLAEINSTHQQILDILSSIPFTEIDRRHERNGRIITIRSYVIDIMVDHERQHAAEIDLWRRGLELSIDPAAIVRTLKQSRANFMKVLDSFTETDVLDKRAVGVWSVSDLVGHVADWEQRMLDAAYHIYDPSRPLVPPLGEASADWNNILAERRAGKSWPENYRDLRETQTATDKLVETLNPGDWKLRGPYPWSDDQGTLAELATQITEHYLDHLPDLERWSTQKRPEPQA